MKPIHEIKKLNTKNLLAFYKAERKRFFSLNNNYRCNCCGEYNWHINSKIYANQKKQYEEHENYLKLVKEELNTREHVERK